MRCSAVTVQWLEYNGVGLAVEGMAPIALPAVRGVGARGGGGVEADVVHEQPLRGHQAVGALRAGLEAAAQAVLDDLVVRVRLLIWLAGRPSELPTGTPRGTKPSRT